MWHAIRILFKKGFRGFGDVVVELGRQAKTSGLQVKTSFFSTARPHFGAPRGRAGLCSTWRSPRCATPRTSHSSTHCLSLAPADRASAQWIPGHLPLLQSGPDQMLLPRRSWLVGPPAGVRRAFVLGVARHLASHPPRAITHAQRHHHPSFCREARPRPVCLAAHVWRPPLRRPLAALDALVDHVVVRIACAGGGRRTRTAGADLGARGALWTRVVLQK